MGAVISNSKHPSNSIECNRCDQYDVLNDGFHMHSNAPALNGVLDKILPKIN